MIKQLPALAALAAAALLATACADTTNGTPAGQALTPLPRTSGATSFPTASTANPVPTVSASSRSVTLAPPPTPTSSAPSTWSIATARQKYLAYVHPGNVDIASFNKIYDKKNVSVQTFTDACADLAKDQTNLARQLAAGNWPPEVAGLARNFATQIIDLGYHYIQRSLSPSVAAAKKELLDSPDTQILANAIRAVLKLPKVK